MPVPKIQQKLYEEIIDVRNERDEQMEFFSHRLQIERMARQSVARENAAIRLALYGKPTTDNEKAFALAVHSILLRPTKPTHKQKRKMQQSIDRARAYLDALEKALMTGGVR